MADDPHGDHVTRRPAPMRGTRPRKTRRSEGPIEAHVQQLAAIGELMLGAAFADGVKVGVEVVAICEQLKEFVEAPLLPVEVRRRLDRFDPDTFDVEAACAELTFGDDADRTNLIDLILTVTSADNVLERGEIDYILRVARAVGLDADTLTFEGLDEA